MLNQEIIKELRSREAKKPSVPRDFVKGCKESEKSPKSENTAPGFRHKKSRVEM